MSKGRKKKVKALLVLIYSINQCAQLRNQDLISNALNRSLLMCTACVEVVLIVFDVVVDVLEFDFFFLGVG